MRKRAVSLALCLCMVLSLLPSPVLAVGKHPFTDVAATDWFNDSVQYVYEHELMTGTTGTTFSPYRTTSRGMLVTILYRLEDSPAVNGTCPFPDVASGRIFEKPITWAANKGIVNGYASGNFGPDDDLTRQQMAAILYRYAQDKGYDTTASANLDEYTDAKSISSYAQAAMAWANAKELINGTSAKALNPGGSATRAQAAAILTRFCQNVVPQPPPPSPIVDPPPPVDPPKITPTSYTVTFDLNYGDDRVYQTLSVEAGEKITAPEKPTRDKYHFLGWYTSATGGSKFNFNKVINAITTLYAHWSIISSGSSGGNYTPVYTYTVTFMSEGSIISTQTVSSGNSIMQPTAPTREGYSFVGWYSDNALTIPYSFSSVVTSNITLYAKWEEVLADNFDDNNNNGVPDSLDLLMGYGTDSYDSDGDGVPDYFEGLYGTDKNLVDTDNDGLPDGYELYTLGTDPLKVDSDENGTSDAEEDADSDGLTNLREYQLQTNPRKADTDNDGLTDYREVTDFHTDPLKEDSDADGLHDSDEFTYQMNPLNPITLNDGILDGNRDFTVLVSGDTSDNGSISPSLEIDLKGNQIQTLSVEKIDNSDVFLNTSIPGYMGNAYEFNVDGSFSRATLTFELDENLLSADSDPAIYYWNETAQTLEELDNQTREGNLLRAELSHFSSYAVLDKTRYTNSVLEYEIKAPTSEELQNKTFDVMLVLDESGSISGSNFSLMKQLCLDLLDDLTEEDRIGVITFDETVRTIIGLSDKTEVGSVISNLIQHDGSTALYDAINTGINEISSDSKSTKVIIALTDGQDNESRNSSESVATRAINANVIIYTIGVGSNVSRNDLTVIAESTHGQYYATSNFDELSGVFERIIADADLYKDSDGDGISDYHEKAISNGTLKTGNGASITSLALVRKWVGSLPTASKCL